MLGLRNFRVFEILEHLPYILEDFETHYYIFALFLQTVYAIEKLLVGFNATQIWYDSVINLTAFSHVQSNCNCNRLHLQVIDPMSVMRRC